MSKALTPAHIRQAANALACEESAVKAVLAVESAGKGFLPDGRPKMLFEGHVFYRRLQACGLNAAGYARSHPDIVYPKWTKSFYKGGSGEWGRLTRAMGINAEAACASASWGLFQIMGFNHRLCGFRRITDFTAAMHEHEGRHLEAFVAYLRTTRLDRHLRAGDWKAFAEGYNGPGYAANKYDVKLARAYARAGGQAVP